MNGADPTPRVLLVCDFLVKYTAGLARGLADRGCPVALLTREHDGEFGGEPGAMCRHVAETLPEPSPHIRLSGRVRDPRAWGGGVAVTRAGRRLAPDVVHLQSTVATDPRLILFSGARRGRYALTVHDVRTHPGDRPEMLSHRALSHLLVRNAGVVFVHAEALREPLEARFGSRTPIVVLPHGIDPPAPRPLPARPSVLFFGRISHYKGLDVLLDAMPLVWRRLPDVPLTVAGEGALPAHPVLADDRVHVRNEHVPEREVPELYAGHTCVALPYREASQSGVGSGAKRFGRAVVVTRTGGLPELVADGSGLVVAPDDPVALGDALVALLSEPSVAEDMGRAGVAGVERRSGWHRIAELTLDAYARYLPKGS